MNPHLRFFIALSLPLLALSTGWYFIFGEWTHQKRMEILSESLPPAFNKEEFAILQRFRRAVAGRPSNQLFEGLPHSYWETESFENERDTKRVRQQESEYFYEEPLTFTPLDESLIFELLSQVDTFKKSWGAKACGGYHADWLLEWVFAPDQLHQIQFCFGCGEANLKGPGYAIHADINHDAETKLQALLTSYTKNRPAFQRRKPLNE